MLTLSRSGLFFLSPGAGRCRRGEWIPLTQSEEKGNVLILAIAILSLLFYSHWNGKFLTLPISLDSASNCFATVNQPLLEAA